MDSQALMTISAAVVALVQLVKWSGLKDSKGPLAVLVCSALGVLFWGWAKNDLTREVGFDYFAGWIVVMTSAAGVFGFTRSTGDSIAKFKNGTGDGGSNTSGMASLALAVVMSGALLAGCGSKVPPALVTANPIPADVAQVQRIAGRVADGVTLGLQLVDSTGALIDSLPLSTGVKDLYDCSVLRVVGVDNPSAAVSKACGAAPLPTLAAAPLTVARDNLKKATTCPSLRSTTVLALAAVDPLIARFDFSGNASLMFASVAIRSAFTYARSFLESGGECSVQ